MAREKPTVNKSKVPMAKNAASKQDSIATHRQQEQRRHTAELDAALATGDPEKIMSTLYELWPWDNPPNRAAELEPHKAGIIKEMLLEVKNMQDSWAYMVVASGLELLEQMGVKWSELAVIRRAIEGEDRRRSKLGMWESSYAHQISQGDIEKVISVLDHAGYKYGSDPDTDALFNDKIQVIQKWMQRMLDISIADGIYAWRMIHDMDLPWDSVYSWWDDHKADIMRRLLEMIKDGAYGTVLDIIDEDLRPLNLRWPELAVIKRSAELEMERQAAQDDLDEADEDDEEDEGPIWRRITPEESIVDDMFRNMRDGRWQAIKNGIAALEDRDLDDGDIEALLNPQQESIVRWLDSKLRQRTHDQLILGQMWQLLEIGARWPNLRKFVEAHKDQLVRNMLEDLKNFNDAWVLENMEGHLRQLSELGMNWPEMAVISNSVNAELDRIHNIDESGDMLGYRISKGDLIDGMRDSLRAGVNGAWSNNYAHLRPFWKPDFTVRKLTGIKPDIVAWINKYLSSDNPANWRYGKRAVVDLDHLGVDWPELWRTVDSNKRAWLHPWLSEVKELLPRGHWDDLADLEDKIVTWQRMLDSHGIKWPETETILSSIRAATNVKGHLGEGQLAKGVDLRNYVKSDGRGTLFLNIPVDQEWQTSGKGRWSTVAKPVKVLSIKQDMEIQGAHGWISDMGVEFDTSTWDVETDGLIYTDPQFLAQLHKFLMGLGVPRDIVSTIGYSEQGMQEDTYVSFDANAFGEYVADQFVIGDAATMDERKTEIIRAMLVNIRDGNQTRAAGIWNKLKELGAAWPELAAIEKSLRAGKNLTESALAKAAVEEAKQMLWRGLPDGNWWILGRALDKMIYAKVPPSEIYAVLDEYKEDILAQQNKLTQADTASEVMAGVSNLRKIKDIGAGWPEIDQMITRNKHYIMRAALQEIKEYSAEEYGDELPHIYKHLKQLKVDWPEMAVIADGILSIQQLGEDQIANAEKSQVLAELTADVDLLKRISVRLDYYRELLDKIDELRQSGNDWPELKQFEKTIRRQMKRRYDKIQQELASAHPHAVTYAYVDVEDLLGKAAAKDWLYDNRQAIAHALDRTLAHDGYLRATDILLKNLVGWGAKWPEILSVFAKNKAHLIRDMLEKITDMLDDIEQGNTNPDDTKRMQARVALFKEFVPDWPELDIINNSLAANLKQLSEDWHDVDTDDYDEIYGRVGSALQDIDIGLSEPMDKWQAEVAVNALADLAELLDNHDWLDTPTPSEWSIDLVKQKPLFIKALLMALKADSADDVVKAIYMLEQYWHVRWPELETINKSLRVKPVNESEPSYDEEAYRYAEEMAENLPDVASNPSEAMHLFMHLADYPEVVGTEYAEYFQRHKTSWIRFLLTAMKGDEWTADEIYTAVDILQRMNLGWPELDTIQQSIGADFRG